MSESTSRNKVINKAQEVIDLLQAMADEREASHLMRFFKTSPGQYGYGDKFLGIKVPKTRAVAVKCSAMPLSEVKALILSPWHEVRLCGFLILVNKFEKLSKNSIIFNKDAIDQRDEIVDFYLKHANRANNWDLVDLSVYKILGNWLILPSNKSSDEKLQIIDNLAYSDSVWEQRMSMVCTMAPLKAGDASFTLRYAVWHLHHNHDLMHKAVGWMLREMGKRVSIDLLREFLKNHVHEMPRTTLRYAIELMSADEKKRWMTC